MNLTSTNQSLELITSSAETVNFNAAYTDIDKSGASTVATPGSANGSVSAATTTALVAAPGASIYRIVTNVSIYNAGAADNTVQVQKDISAVNRLVVRAVLAANESLHYEDANGWYVLDATGSRKGVGATGAAGAPGGGTVLGVGTSVIDFGTGSSHTTLVVTGQPLVQAGSTVYCWVKPEATVDHSADEHMLETLRVFATDVVAGVGFTLHGVNTSDLFEPLLLPLSYLQRTSGTGAVPGRGKNDRTTRYLGGRGTLLRGQFSVGWLFTQ